jgi:AcrR family transcriptional regulator
VPAAIASKEEIIDRLFTVFRDRGFDGASISDLSRATGLGKSSLYHYFPQGKEQMAEEVLARATGLIDHAILDVARSEASLKLRVRKIIATLEQIYSGGRTPCVLGQLATAAIGNTARKHLREAFEHWICAIAELALEAGMPGSRARKFAEDWVASLQGSLLLQAATGDTGPFERTLKSLLRFASLGPSASTEPGTRVEPT